MPIATISPRATLDNLGSLITFQGKDGQDVCLGYLINFGERGIFDAYIGKVDISTEDAQIHNSLLDAAMLKGLDSHCEIGMHGTFYYMNGQVGTFMGTIVADSSKVKRVGQSITFRRAGKIYKGRLRKDEDCFNFKRVS